MKAASGSPLLVELKDGDTYNGRLVSADAYMNMNLSHVICTAADGSKFYKLETAYIRGSAIKYLRLPPNVLDQAKELADKEEQQREQQQQQYGRGRGGGGRGRGGRGRPTAGSGDYRGGGRGGRGRGGPRGGGRGGGRGHRGGGGRSIFNPNNNEGR